MRASPDLVSPPSNPRKINNDLDPQLRIMAVSFQVQVDENNWELL
jgi:hypothetical protein